MTQWKASGRAYAACSDGRCRSFRRKAAGRMIGSIGKPQSCARGVGGHRCIREAAWDFRCSIGGRGSFWAGHIEGRRWIRMWMHHFRHHGENESRWCIRRSSTAKPVRRTSTLLSAFPRPGYPTPWGNPLKS